MDLTGIAALITALIAAITTAAGAVFAAWRWAVAQGKKDALAEQVQKTLTAKDAEIAELNEDKRQLEAWVEALTRPSGRSQ